MAEFQEVMRQAQRICSASDGCVGCPFPRDGAQCGYAHLIDDDATPEQVAKFESIVMDWAAKNPEPRYPSWKEWWEENFSDSAYMPCPKNFMSNKTSGCSEQPNCPDCMNRPIPADIAEKLGIKPIGGNDDA